MFTGIIQNRGRVVSKQKRGGQIRLAFRLAQKEKNLQLGESIAVSGVCLTVAGKNPKSFEADVVAETLKATTLENLKIGDTVNLERSLKYGDRFGGHFVTGHADGVGRIEKIEKKGRNVFWQISAPRNILSFLASKGSMTVDGVSLTLQSAGRDSFTIALIPHTLRETTLAQKKSRRPRQPGNRFGDALPQSS